MDMFPHENSIIILHGGVFVMKKKNTWSNCGNEQNALTENENLAKKKKNNPYPKSLLFLQCMLFIIIITYFSYTFTRMIECVNDLQSLL